jgi:hypothetical protein
MKPIGKKSVINKEVNKIEVGFLPFFAQSATAIIFRTRSHPVVKLG